MARVVRFALDSEYLDDTTDQTLTSPEPRSPLLSGGEFYDQRHEYPSTPAIGSIPLPPESPVSVPTPLTSPPGGPSLTPNHFNTPLSPYSHYGSESSPVFPTQRDITSGPAMNINSLPLNSSPQSSQYSHIAAHESLATDSGLYDLDGLHISLSSGLRQMFYDMSTPLNSPENGIMESDSIGPYLDHPATQSCVEEVRIWHPFLTFTFRIGAGERKTSLRVSDVLQGMYDALQQPVVPATIAHNGAPLKWIDTLPEEQWRMYGLKPSLNIPGAYEIETTNVVQVADPSRVPRSPNWATFGVRPNL